MTLPELALQARAQWNAIHGCYYRVHDSVLNWNFTEQDLVSYSTTELSGVPVIYGVASEKGVSLGLPARNFWLSLWGDVPAAQADKFVSALQALALEKRKIKIVIGADEFHHVPGVPIGTGAHLIKALTKAGFQGAAEADFVGDVFSPSVIEYVQSSLSSASQQGWQLTPLESEADYKSLHTFLAKEFPGRWTREFEFWSARKDTFRGQWLSLYGNSGRDKRAILGFARIALRGPTDFETGWTPGALRMPLSGEADHGAWLATDGCLGPIGVASAERGKGAGKILLGLVLNTLREAGAKRICIDWTDAFKYYEPLHFERARQFWNAWK